MLMAVYLCDKWSLGEDHHMATRTRMLAPALALMLGAAPALSAETTLRLSNWLPASHPMVKDFMVPWAEDVARVTEGRVEVQILDAPLGPPPAHFDLVATGAADVAFSAHGYTPGKFTLTEISELPFLTPDAESHSVAYWRVHEAMLADKNEHAGTHVLALFGHGPGHLFMSERDVSPLDAVGGAKVRVNGSLSSALASELGMTPVQAPSSESFEILSNGVADGIMFPDESVPFFKLDSVLTKGLTVPGGMYNVSFFFVMNQARYDSLSDADRAAIDSISGEGLSRKAGQVWDAADLAGREVMQGKVAFTAATDADMATLTAASEAVVGGVRERVNAKGVDFDAAVAMFKDELGKAGQ